MRRIFLTVSLLLMSLIVRADGSDLFFKGVDALPPDERFRQLSLMLMVSDGADETLISALENNLGTAADPNQDASGFDFDDYTTPLIRIVDQESMLAGAARLFRFSRDHAVGIAQRLQMLQQERSNSPSPFPVGAISEDAIIIRNAIADSIDYTMTETNMEPESPRMSPRLSANYRERTAFLRNNLEYVLFTVELDRITQEAVASVGGRTEAYERMFDDEVDADAIDKKIKAAEYAYGWDRDFDKRAAKMAQEILDNILETESTPKK